ncbi:TonB-dependent receptor plug domain-containing protein [Shewanella zhangzhouensis]|uniref:TonB-dependent receptor plug domain-containing protein n=1 Tax=Shewanella zhangzhouensis TaxID=2864213 RepID=UPI001C6565F8|nr:TonB-dependent receptor [Shewanella zhangzhouensis]QYK05971.1 TonB-dependent receptor [Shewanella zhangzhouensis]
MKKTILTLAIQAAVLGGMSMTAVAADEVEVSQVKGNQPQQNAEAEQQTIEKISVTGSRIKRDSFSVATPLATLDSEAIDDAGTGSLSAILVDELPQVAEGTSNTNSQSSVQNTGLSTIDLRNLGTNRTLTLIDGRRVVSNSYSGNYVSLSTIPTSFVDKVEIITGGASATYGSDAVAGVVNIITEQDKQGVTFNVRSGQTESGGEELGVDGDFGALYADGKGYLFMAASYNKDWGLDYWDRNRAQQQESWSYDTKRMCNTMLTETYDTALRTNAHCMRDITQADWRDLNDSIPGGVFNEASSTRPDAGFWYDGQTLRNDWHEEKYGIHFQQFDWLKVPDESVAAAVKTEYDFDSGTQAYFQLQYSRNHSVNNKSPESSDENEFALVRDPVTGEFVEEYVGRIPKNNPFVPQEIFDGASSRGITWDRNFAEVGAIVNENTRTTYRSWAGLRGFVWDNWEWDLSVGYGKFRQEQNRQNEIDVVKLRNALQAEKLADGTIQCIDSDARADGCVPVNLFGEGAISVDAANYIRSNPTITTDITMTNVLGYITGDLFDLPAGPVASAFGFEYRRDTQSVDTNVPNGGVTFNYVPSFEGDVSVYEAFGEASLPLLRDVTAAKSLSMDLSLRVADYSWSTTDLIKSYKAGLVYEPAEGYMVRANWATAQRAPTITELLSPPRGDYDSFSDVCDGVTATSTGEGHANCRQDPGIAATIAADGVFNDDNNGYSPNVGNENLKEESAETFTVGVSLAPSFIEGLRVAVDYYDIKIEDAMTSLENEDIIKFCYASSLPYGDDNAFCNDIKRDGDGQIIEVQQRVINADETRTSGYDLALDYKYDLDAWGDLKLKLDWSHVIDYTITATGPDGQYTNSYLGQLSSGIFEDKGSASLTWRLDNLRLRWSVKYKSDIRRSQSTHESWEKAMELNAENCAAADAACVANPEPLWGNELPSVTTHNFSASYGFDLGSNAELRLYGGVNNLFDERGPFVIGGSGSYDSAYGGGQGRYGYLGAEVKF